MPVLTIERDDVLDVAYIRLSNERVARTIEHDDAIAIDLDQHGVVVGIEILHQAAELPFSQLIDRFHVRSEVVDMLRMIRPSVSSFAALQSGNDGHAIAAVAPAQLIPA